MENKIQPVYQTLGQICTRLECGPRRVKSLIQEGLPVAVIAGQYTMTEEGYVDWVKNKIRGKKDGS
jgi:hypothetical protein